ncbi:hypothetical protein HQS1_46930 [Delftia lacustris]|nr:hypothetical protein HQS1_46930 [Delftia lacustris]
MRRRTAAGNNSEFAIVTPCVQAGRLQQQERQCATALVRSIDLSSCSTADSNDMLSCCGAGGRDGTAIDGLRVVRRDWVMGLLACGLNTGEASSKSKLGQLQV